MAEKLTLKRSAANPGGSAPPRNVTHQRNLRKSFYVELDLRLHAELLRISKALGVLPHDLVAGLLLERLPALAARADAADAERRVKTKVFAKYLNTPCSNAPPLGDLVFNSSDPMAVARLRRTARYPAYARTPPAIPSDDLDYE